MMQAELNQMEETVKELTKHNIRNDQAILVLHQMLEKLEKWPDDLTESLKIKQSMWMDKLGYLYKSMGQYSEGLRYHLKAKKNYESINQEASLNYVTCLNNIGIIYMEDPKNIKPDKTKEHFKESLKIMQVLCMENSIEYAMGLNALGVFYQSNGENAKAQEVLYRSLVMLKNDLPNNRIQYGLVLHNYSYTLITQDISQAIKNIKETIAIYSDIYGADHGEVAHYQHNLALLLYKNEQLKEAGQYLNESMEKRYRLMKEVFDTTSEAGMKALLDMVGSNLSFAISIASNDPEYAPSAMNWVLCRKSIIQETMSDLKKVIAKQTPEDEYKDIIKSYNKKCKDVIELEWRLNQSQLTTTEEIGLEDLRLQLNHIETKLNFFLNQVKKDIKSIDPLSYRQVQKHLPEGSALIEFVLYDAVSRGFTSKVNQEHYGAFVLLSNKEPIFINLGLAFDINLLIDRLRHHMIEFEGKLAVIYNEKSRGFLKESISRFKAISFLLYQKIFRPLENLLHDVNRIFISPDGLINNIPFESLVDNDKSYLALRFQFAYVSSGRNLLNFHTPITSSGTVVFANPDFELSPNSYKVEVDKALQFDGLFRNVTTGMKWRPLNASIEEANLIYHTLDNNLQYGPVNKKFLGKMAVREAFLSLKPHRIIHIATHGFFHENRLLKSHVNPLVKYGIVLAGGNSNDGIPSDGKITAADISQMTLSGTDLVVLSACGTGLGDIQNAEGAYGLRRAFQIAGVNTILTSLYNVNDFATKEFMKAFYTFIGQGETKINALCQSQRLMRENNDNHIFSHPYFWASFTLWGNPI
jgi:CHAT domain-containing protein